MCIMIEFNSGELGNRVCPEKFGGQHTLAIEVRAYRLVCSLALAISWLGSEMSTARLSEANRLERRDVKISLAEPY